MVDLSTGRQSPVVRMSAAGGTGGGGGHHNTGGGGGGGGGMQKRRKGRGGGGERGGVNIPRDTVGSSDGGVRIGSTSKKPTQRRAPRTATTPTTRATRNSSS